MNAFVPFYTYSMHTFSIFLVMSSAAAASLLWTCDSHAGWIGCAILVDGLMDKGSRSGCRRSREGFGGVGGRVAAVGEHIVKRDTLRIDLKQSIGAEERAWAQSTRSTRASRCRSMRKSTRAACVCVCVQRSPLSRASFSSCACWRRSATCAAITRWRSAISVHLAHAQSRHRQKRLWPLSALTTPWFRQRAHFGVRGKRSASAPPDGSGDPLPASSPDMPPARAQHLQRLSSARETAY